ncbi:hypothetical protein ACFY1L_49445 [Streptomyces sp. NPDC001663]|uniref:hypothetical protein n=1 Tax=Streptomyces sp. NPDC001663 TaxID=3364597 RepID=UPI003697C31A
MNRTALAPRRPLADESASAPYAELTHGPEAGPPIYAQLVAEWRAEHRAVPAYPEVQWASFADLPGA